MKHEILAPGIEIYCADCLDVMRDMPDESVDVVFTSPPYNVGLSYGVYDDNREWGEFLSWLYDIYETIGGGLSNTGRLYAILSDLLMFESKQMLDDIGLNFGQVLTWCKPNLVGGAGRITGDWNYLTEQILLYRKGKRTKMLNGQSNTHSYFEICTPQSNFKEGRFHPAQFPIELPDRIISRTPGNIVMDPFMGSGSTGIAAIKNQRNFIGIEIDPDYYEIAKKRIKEALMQPRLL